MYCQAKRLSDT